jgi:hypothetical protein
MPLDNLPRRNMIYMEIFVLTAQPEMVAPEQSERGGQLLGVVLSKHVEMSIAVADSSARNNHTQST